MATVVTYNNSEIVNMTDSGTKTLLTAGKICDYDIVVQNISGGAGSVMSGTYTPSARLKQNETVSFNCPGATHFIIRCDLGACALDTGAAWANECYADANMHQYLGSNSAGTSQSSGSYGANTITSGYAGWTDSTFYKGNFTASGITFTCPNNNTSVRQFQPGITYYWWAW